MPVLQSNSRNSVRGIAEIKEHMVIKRDGRIVPWDLQRVIRAVALSFFDVRYGDGDNPFKNDLGKMYGLDTDPYMKSVSIGRRAENLIDLKYYHQGVTPTIEQIQDMVEIAIMTEGEYEVARNYVLYRARRSEMRMQRYDPQVMQDYVRTAKYMRYREDLHRRETLDEAVDRVQDMHMRRFMLDDRMPTLDAHTVLRDKIKWAFDHVRTLEVWPSSRSMQFGGKPVEVHEARMFNCTYSHANRVEFFREYIYLLLCGCGCGFSVQFQHVNSLPILPVRDNEMELEVKHVEVQDTIIGWADAVHELLMSYYQGYYVEFNYSKIRPRGAPLKTSGGKAPGHMPLRKALTQVRKVMDGASGRRLKPIEVYDICMFLAKAVLAGGVRRSATICLFSVDDGEMMTAKTGDWHIRHKHREASNNSAVLVRSEVTQEQFDRIFNHLLEYGEPGFFFTENEEYGTNPCGEIGLNPVVDVTIENIDRLHGLGATDLELGDRVYGWQFCNLTTINGAKVTGADQFYEFCQASAIIGTLQASYSHVPYLGPITQFINEREALLGVSICGVMDCPKVLLDPEVLRKGAEIVMQTNREIAEMIDIEPAARTTCVKPEGTASLVLGSGSGVHPHHARRYFRHVQANRVEPVFQYFKEHNPNMTEPSNQNPEVDDVICFPIEAPRDAICLEDLTGVEFLECVRVVQENWVQPGTAYEDYSPGLTHNVSNTVAFTHDERLNVRNWIWNHRYEITGITLLMDPGVFVQAPREAVVTEQHIAKWNALKCLPVDYSLMYESSDNTSLTDTKACAGGSCDWSPTL